MSLKNLSNEETEVVRKCLECVVSGKVILHDSEFQAIMGITVNEFIEIYESWPDINENHEQVQMAIHNSMNNILGFPHGRHHRWDEFMDVPLEKIKAVFSKWRGSGPNTFFDGMK